MRYQVAGAEACYRERLFVAHSEQGESHIGREENDYGQSSKGFKRKPQQSEIRHRFHDREVEIEGLLWMNKQEARGNDRNMDARKEKERSVRRQTQQSIINEASEV